MGVLPSELTSGGVWYLQSWDKTSDSKKGQMEDMQLQITAHTLPNRANTDADGLNDSEEMNLGSDGFATGLEARHGRRRNRPSARVRRSVATYSG